MTKSPTVKMDRDIPPKILAWLMVGGSLTALLEAKAKQPLKVERTFEGYRKLTLVQKQQLGWVGNRLNRPMIAWVREVLLYGDDAQPWVVAQSVFPLPSLKGDAKRLQHLKNTPIGYVLFKRQTTLPHIRRLQHTDTGWQRQTCYDWQGRHLLISETFLDAFINNIKSD